MGVSDDVKFDVIARTITVRGHYTVGELCEYLMKVSDLLHLRSNVIYCKTPTEYEFRNGWVLTPKSEFHLKGAALCDSTHDTVYCNIYTLGNLGSKGSVFVEQNGKIVWGQQGHIDILVKVKENGKEIDNMSLTAHAFYEEDNDEYSLTGGYDRFPVPLAISAP